MHLGMGKTMKHILTGLTLLAATPAAAQDILFSIDHTNACLQEATAWHETRDCIGASMVQCIEATPLGASTLGMNECTARELEYWDDWLNEAYGILRTQEKAEDVESGALPGYTSQADTLLEMQRAWISFRDAKCTYERAQWTGGTGGGPAELSCLLSETAEQTLYLRAMAQTY